MPGRDAPWTAMLGLAALTFICYAGALGNSFHYDDSHSIVENHHIRVLSAIPSFFLDSATFSNEASMAMYRPLLQATFAVNYALGDYSVWGFRAVNLLVHILCVGAVFALVLPLSGARAAWFAAAVFALHPVNSQAVNYISSRSELLSVLGVLGALYLHLHRGQWRLACVLYALALLCKSTAVALLPLLVLAQTTRGTDLLRSARQALPYALVTAAYLIVITMDGFLPRSLGQEVRPYDVQLYTQVKAIVFYFQLVVMPVALSVEHAFAEAPSLGQGAVLASAALVASVLALTCRYSRVLPLVTLGTLWFFCGLALTSLVPLNVLVNEHRMYLPTVGLLILLCGAGSHRLLHRRGQRYSHPGSRWLAACLLLACGALTMTRNAVWADELSLWRDAAAKAPGMFRVQSNFGLALYENGELESARSAFERSIELNPRYSKSWSNLGLVYEDLGLLTRAEHSYGRALQLSPDLSGPHNNLGRLCARLGRHEEAEPLLRQAVRMDPRNVQAWVNLGRVLQRRARVAEAESAYRQAISLDRGYAPALNNLGLLLGELGHAGESRQMLLEAVEADPSYTEAAVNLRLQELRDRGVEPRSAYRLILDEFPDHVEIWNALAESELRSSRWLEAAAAFEQVVERSPTDVGARRNLALAYRNAGRTEEAIATYEKALELGPADPGVLNNLASAYAAVGDLAAALRVTRAALALDPADARAKANQTELQRAAAGRAGSRGEAVPESP